MSQRALSLTLSVTKTTSKTDGSIETASKQNYYTIEGLVYAYLKQQIAVGALSDISDYKYYFTLKAGTSYKYILGAESEEAISAADDIINSITYFLQSTFLDDNLRSELVSYVAPAEDTYSGSFYNTIEECHLITNAVATDDTDAVIDEYFPYNADGDLSDYTSVTDLLGSLTLSSIDNKVPTLAGYVRYLVSTMLDTRYNELYPWWQSLCITSMQNTDESVFNSDSLDDYTLNVNNTAVIS